MTMWVFGDSFTSGFSYENNWLHQLSKKYQEPIRGLSVPGSSLGYTINTVEQRIKDFRENEIVIISLTSANRTYYLKDYPHISQPHQFDQDWINLDGISDEIKLAIELHTKYFSDVIYESNIALVTSFLYRLDYLASNNNYKIIVLPCFEDVLKTVTKHRANLKNIILPHGCLFDVSTCEFEFDNYEKLFKEVIMKYDPRSAHLTYTNHKILYKKLIDTIDKNLPLDFSNGFAKELITMDRLKDQQFINNEFSDSYGHYKK